MGILRLAGALENDVRPAVDILKSGGVVAIPTDTLYGLAACALDRTAVERVFRLKGRSQGVPLPLLLAEPEDIFRYAVDIPEAARALMERFWPGPLTLVFKKAASISDVVSGGHDTVALRVPDHVVPRAIVRGLGAPITGTSANRTGGPGPTTAMAVRETFGNEVDMVVDGGDAPVEVASTVVDLSGGQPRVLRRGAVTEQDIEELSGKMG